MKSGDMIEVLKGFQEMEVVIEFKGEKLCVQSAVPEHDENGPILRVTLFPWLGL